eukprot:CAMPEP_0182483652 /NCGR_PEP_ID=MMETSP1319-20130603/41806_1 /TAXON_ID=172717 /ORGANISM="Bolidomonas pacifica, Strain RCC208" /LENGTH=420 /DNA_ID=CAMNT_0024685479 /DNA_START=96 /DNA_END=1358 /DNA_ORIENTATION=+
MALLGTCVLFNVPERLVFGVCRGDACGVEVTAKLRATDGDVDKSIVSPTQASSSSPHDIAEVEFPPSVVKDRNNQETRDYSFALPGYTPPAGTSPMFEVQFGDFTHSEEKGFERRSEAVTDESEYTLVHDRPKILRVDALHGCWAHAVLDQWVYWFQARKEFKGEPFFLWFDRDYFLQFPVHQGAIDSELKQYKPTAGYKDLCDLLKPSEIVFEHLLDAAKERVLLKDAMVVTIHKDMDELSAWAMWDDESIYHGRPKRAERIPESIRYPFYTEMSEYILTEMGLIDVGPSASDKSTLVTIVTRKTGAAKRRFSPSTLQHVKSTVASAGYGSPGLTFWEDMTLREQLEKLRRSKFVIAKHGAGFTNTVFAHPNTTVIEVSTREEFADDRSHMYDYTCAIAGCTHVATLDARSPPLSDYLK